MGTLAPGEGTAWKLQIDTQPQTSFRTSAQLQGSLGKGLSIPCKPRLLYRKHPNYLAGFL